MNTISRGHSSSRTPGTSLSGNGGIESATRSKLLQALAVGLQCEAVAYTAGRKDGEEGASFRPLDFDLFSYASGFAFGRQFPKRGGEYGCPLRSNY